MHELDSLGECEQTLKDFQRLTRYPLEWCMVSLQNLNAPIDFCSNID